ncbi:MAG: 5-formyltetrahydrofolate cyclo-ligase [Alphaproteobacteria bacterium]
MAQRSQTAPAERYRARNAISTLLIDNVAQLTDTCIGFYWPIKGEIDLRAFMRNRVQHGARAALPVVVEKGAPLEFWSWRPDMRLQRGVWHIPIPAERRPVRPSILLVALLGFDDAGYRLGYGGGYYDRTLAAMTPRPLTIGVGFESGRMATIYPQPHDIRLDAIATEAGFVWCEEPRNPKRGPRSLRAAAAERPPGQPVGR